MKNNPFGVLRARVLGFAVLLACCGWSLGARADTIHRFALVVGANSGGAGRVPLRYANKDAQNFAQLLRDLGGINGDDLVLVQSATRAAVQRRAQQLQPRLAAAAHKGERVEVLFYYSGHASEIGLLLGGDTLSYRDFKSMVMGLPAEVRVMVIDSCESGLLIASKGGQRRPAFLLDASAKTQGNAIITSASSDEAAQESANIAGSFFTYYLMSGLRGGADLNGDGKITLNEAYYYAYAETLARTEKTRAGAQHPSYEFQLAGTGDLVLTDVRQGSAALTFASQVQGRYFVRNRVGHLIAELNKPAGRPMELALEPGAYVVVRELDHVYAEADFQLGPNGKIAAGDLPFRNAKGEVNPTRGDVPEAKVVAVDSVADSLVDLSSYVRTSQKEFEVSFDEMTFQHLTFKMRSGVFYTLYDIAGRSGYHDENLMPAFGIGAYFDRDGWTLSTDLRVMALAGAALFRCQASFGYPLGDRFSFFGGPSYTFTEMDHRIYEKADPHLKFVPLSSQGGDGLWAWAGLQVGINYQL